MQVIPLYVQMKVLTPHAKIEVIVANHYQIAVDKLALVVDPPDNKSQIPVEFAGF